MALKVVWTDLAVFQLEDIFNYYLDNVSLINAQKKVKLIIAKASHLEKNPNIGAKEPLLSYRKFNYRYLVEGNYKIIYWVEADYINIASVFDCRQNPEKMTII